MRRSPRSLARVVRRAVGCRHHHRRRLQRSGNPASPSARSRRAATRARRGARSPARCHARRDRRPRDLALRVRDPRRTPSSDARRRRRPRGRGPGARGQRVARTASHGARPRRAVGARPVRVPGRTSPPRRRAATTRRRGRRRARRARSDARPTGREAEVVAHAARVLAVDADDDALADGAGVTLLVTEDEARGLAFAAANGVLTLALAPPEDACCR